MVLIYFLIKKLLSSRRIHLTCFALFFLNGCIVPTVQEINKNIDRIYYENRDDTNPALLTVFLNLHNINRQEIRIVISGLDASIDGNWISLLTQPAIINTSEVKLGQVILARKSIPTGNFQHFRVTLSGASNISDNIQQTLEIEQSEVEVQLEQAVTIDKDDSQSVFIGFDASASLKSRGKFTPVFSVRSSDDKPLPSDLAFVSCPDINTVYFFRTDRNWIQGSIGVTGKPTYIFVNQPENRLYVLAENESMIKSYDIFTSALIDQFQIPMTLNPSFMTVTPDMRWAYLIDSEGDYLVKMDLSSGNFVSRMRFGEKLKYISYLPRQEKLAVSLEISQSVAILDPMTMDTLYTIPVSGSPQGLLENEEFLYITESISNNIIVYDFSNAKIIKRINTGFTPKRLIAFNNNVIVANYDSSSVSVFLSRYLNIPKEVETGEHPQEMAYSQRRGWLYVGDENPGGLSVIDITTYRNAGYLDLGARPLGLAIMQ